MCHTSNQVDSLQQAPLKQGNPSTKPTTQKCKWMLWMLDQKLHYSHFRHPAQHKYIDPWAHGDISILPEKGASLWASWEIQFNYYLCMFPLIEPRASVLAAVDTYTQIHIAKHTKYTRATSQVSTGRTRWFRTNCLFHRANGPKTFRKWRWES